MRFLLHSWMFLAIIIPPARKSRMVAGLVLASFATSALFAWAPLLSGLSEGVRTIILTVALSALAAALFPVDEKDAGEKDTDVAGVAAARAEGDSPGSLASLLISW